VHSDFGPNCPEPGEEQIRDAQAAGKKTDVSYVLQQFWWHNRNPQTEINEVPCRIVVLWFLDSTVSSGL
jgi:hypothetical protein